MSAPDEPLATCRSPEKDLSSRAVAEAELTGVASCEAKAKRRRLRRVALVALLIIVAGGSVFLVVRAFRDARRRMPEFHWRIADAEVATAVERAAESVRAAPEAASAWGYLGMVLLANKLEHDAAPILREAERLDPRDPRWPYLLGVALVGKSPDAAMGAFGRSVACCDADGSQPSERRGAARLRLAETLAANGRLDEAETHFRAVGEGPLAPAAHYGLGVLAVARGELAEGKGHWMKCLGSPATRQKAAVQLAALARRMKEADAAELGQRAGQLPPDVSWPDPYLEECVEFLVGREARLRHATLLEEQGQIPRAMDMLRAIARDYPDASSYTTVGVILGRRGFHRESEEYLRKCLNLEPDLVRAQYYLSLALFAQGESLRARGQEENAREKFAEAADWSRRAVACAPSNGEAHFQLGLCLWCLEQRDEAIGEFRAAIQSRPEMVDAHLWLGRLLGESQSWEEAEQCLRDAAKIARPQDPRPSRALEQLERLRRERGS